MYRNSLYTLSPGIKYMYCKYLFLVCALLFSTILMMYFGEQKVLDFINFLKCLCNVFVLLKNYGPHPVMKTICCGFFLRRFSASRIFRFILLLALLFTWLEVLFSFYFFSHKDIQFTGKPYFFPALEWQHRHKFCGQGPFLDPVLFQSFVHVCTNMKLISTIIIL